MKDPVDHAVDAFFRDGFTDGDIISLHWLKDNLDIAEPQRIEDVQKFQFEMLGKVEAFKDLLLVTHRVALRNVRGEGYLVVPPGEQAKLAVEEGLKAAARGMKRANKLLTHARTEEMSDYERTRHTDAQLKVQGIQQIMANERKDVFSLFDGRPREIAQA